MKKIFVLAFMLFSIVSMAQDAKQRLSADERAQRRTEKISEKLALTTEQKAKVKALMAQDIKKNDEMRQAMVDRKKAMRADMEKILDEKQRAKLEEMRKQGKGKMRERIKERRSGQGADNDDVSEYMDDVY